MSKVQASFRCDHCGGPRTKEATEIRRAIKCGAGLYCDRTCAGLGRRDARTDAEKREAKSLYDITYREKNKSQRKLQKAEYFQRTYDPEAARIERAKTMDQHVLYLREYYKDPVKKAEKVAYDRERRDRARYGELWEIGPILRELEQEIRDRCPSKYERMKARGYYINQRQRRRTNVEATQVNC